jgi:hypothetical protein
MHILSLSGFRVEIPQKGETPQNESMWRHWRLAEQMRETYFWQRGNTLTSSEMLLEAFMQDFVLHTRPSVEVQYFPGEDRTFWWLDAAKWSLVGQTWVIAIPTWDNNYHLSFWEKKRKLRMEISEGDDRNFAGKTTVKWFNL